MSEAETDDEEAEEPAPTEDGTTLSERVIAVGAGLYERTRSIQTTVRDRTAPAVDTVDTYCGPVLAARWMAIPIVLVVLALLVEGLVQLQQTLASTYATAATVTLALVGGLLFLIAAGASIWGGSRSTAYW